MAGFFQARQAEDLALGKSPLRKVSVEVTVGEALKALKRHSDTHLSLWAEESFPSLINKSKEAGFVTNNAKAVGATRFSGESNGGWSKEVRSSSDEVKRPLSRECTVRAGEEKERLWRCVGKVGMVDIICFLARDESLADLAAALCTPLSVLQKPSSAVQHVDPQTKLFDALGRMLDGAQHLVVPIDRSISRRLARYNSMPNGKDFNKLLRQGAQHASHVSVGALPGIDNNAWKTESGSQEYCWLTPEDVVRFLLSCVGLFSPLPMMSIQQLGIIKTDMLTVNADADAISALPLIQQASQELTAVAVVEDGEDAEETKLVGDISAFTLSRCNETAALALATLSVRDFLSYAQDCGGPPYALVELVQSRLYQKFHAQKLASCRADSLGTRNPLSLLRESSAPSLISKFPSMESGSSEESSDEDVSHSPNGPFGFATNSSAHHAQMNRMGGMSKGRMAPLTCRPWSSLVAVMAQALTHRVGYIWVTDEDSCLLGIVTYLDIILCILGRLYSPE